MKIGYARVSNKGQNPDLQIDSLNDAGCEMIFQEKVTGATRERPELKKLMQQLRKGDILVVWKLDRLARSIKDLIQLVNEIEEKGAELNSLNDHIDTTSPIGKFTFHIFAAMAELERNIIRERTLNAVSIRKC